MRGRPPTSRLTDSGAYAAFKFKMDSPGIANLSILRTSSTYVAPTPQIMLFIFFITVSLISPVEKQFTVPAVLGLLRRDAYSGLRWGLNARVSSDSQLHNTSTDSQLNKVRKEVERTNGEVILLIEVAESGATIDRETLDEIEKAGRNDEIDILGITKLDRLTRADPWESLRYLLRLRDAGVLIYAHTHGCFDYNDIYDFQLLVRQVVFAREWYERLVENAEDGQIKKLEVGKWPFGNPPYGYEKDENDYVNLTDTGKKVNSTIIDEGLDGKSAKDIKKAIENKFNIENTPSKSQIENILQNPICAGRLNLKDQVVAHRQELAVTDVETFDELLNIREDQGWDPGDARPIPKPVDRAAYDFGTEYVIQFIDNISKRCKKCGGEFRQNGTEEYLNTVWQTYQCTNNNCGYQGRLLTKSEIDRLHQTFPIRCPFCPATERFEIERVPDADWEFRYYCTQCQNRFACDIVKGIYERAKNNPELKFDWYEDNREIFDSPVPENETDIDTVQKELGGFYS